ncbi:uncharacterized protein LOC110851498 [Folsomia candida]|uniref:DUF4806 domain-containing protein n=1 Tax=Folsomia candida TaxID=158441 RepID=A0A226E646_FOLCA|nr:uncharacterized protein LOC110851498 [Folsomia candida]OXA53102.1 hypothetical protein Fcan01_12237 [Folsomia candida]
MSTNNFVLVKFIDTNEIEVVSTAWLCANNTKCAWPNYKNPSRIVKAVGQHEASEQTWSIHDVKLLGSGHKFATYREALQKLPKVMDQSDADVGSGNDKNRLCRNKGNASDSSGSDGDDSLSPKIPRPPMIGKNCYLQKAGLKESTEGEPIPGGKSSRNKTLSNNNMPFKLCLANQDSTITVKGTQPEVMGGNQISNDKGAGTSSTSNGDAQLSIIGNDNESPEVGILSAALPKGNSIGAQQSSLEVENFLPGNQFQSWVVRNIASLKVQSRNIQDTLDAILLHLDGQKKPQDEIRHQIPLMNMEDVSKGAGYYEILANRESLVTLLRQRGCSNVAKCTRRILSKLCGDQLANCYNWIGSRGGKSAFCDVWMKQVVFDTVRQSLPSKAVTDDEMEAVTKEYLKAAAKRLKKNHCADIAGTISDGGSDFINHEESDDI